MWTKLFRRSRPGDSPEDRQRPTLKARVTEFWKWYVSVAERFYAEIDGERCSDLTPEVSRKIDELLPGMAWVFGPGAGGEGHSFTLTPEGNAHLRFVAQYWLSRAPSVPGWTFYASRQADSVCGNQFVIDDMTFAASELWLTPWVDEQEEVVDLVVWHPLFDRISEKLRWTVTSLWLDEALGEDGVVNWLGEIKLGDHSLSGAIPLRELPEFISELESRYDWKKLPPHETYVGYKGSEPQHGKLRNDVVAGTTCHMDLVYEFPLKESPLEAFGADYVMVALPTAQLPEGKEVDTRGKVEDALTAAFELEASGRVLGGAIGIENTYIDLLLYDGSVSRRLVHTVLGQQGFEETARLHSFVADGR